MLLLIDIPEEWMNDDDGIECPSCYELGRVILKGQPLPEDCEILTREAYSNLCAEATGINGNKLWLKVFREQLKNEDWYTKDMEMAIDKAIKESEDI